MEVEESQSDTEDSGAVDDDLGDNGTCSCDDDSGCNSGNSKIKKLTYFESSEDGHWEACVLCCQFWMTGVNERLFLLNPWRKE
ncbi:hypothetical protein L3X38_008573 [Prunus dulcis]|uniref:Uncharacterized protein n=1 Tax=Prunus dulcis TaxID=3755 RepID=A0AAD4ZX14_PRUDU|nr:hypothetical protein L3X38_008573 [Prunus dulcis]